MAHNIGIQMKRKELTKTFYDDLKVKNLFCLHGLGLYKNISAWTLDTLLKIVFLFHNLWSLYKDVYNLPPLIVGISLFWCYVLVQYRYQQTRGIHPMLF